MATGTPQPQSEAVRRHEGRARAPVAPAAPRNTATTQRQRRLLPSDWHHIGWAMAASYLLTVLDSHAMPSALAAAMALAGSAMVLAGRHAARLDLALPEDPRLRIALGCLAAGLPMLLYGGSIAAAVQAAPDSSVASGAGALVLTGALATMVLKRRLGAVVTVHASLWASMVVLVGSLPAWGLFAAAIWFGARAAMRGAHSDRAERERQRELERAQRRAEELLAEYEQSGLGWFWETDRRGMIVYVSPTIGRSLGKSADTLIGKPFTDLFILDAAGQESERTLVFQLSARSAFTDLAVRAAVTADEERWWSISGRPIHDSFNNFLGFRGSGTDLTEKKRALESETRLAHYDSLTSLANRFQMSQTLEKILNAPREDHRACSVLLLDLDRFKQVNDTMGHPAGDALLRQVAQRLEHTVGKYGRVGRLGGDEFEVILPGRHRREDLAVLAKRIIENLSHPYSIEGANVVIGVSIGVALAPEDGVTSEALIRNADLALYAAKDGGRGRHHFYAADLHSDAEERRQLEHDLREALALGGLALAYQPVVQTSTEKITGFEALLRWKHPVLGHLSPAKFIPIAEDTGLIAQIGEWALRTACDDLARWPETVRVAVNVSPLQFANPALPAIVTSALASSQVAPDRLELEITESVFLNDDAGTDAMFAALKRVGVRLALDDFGTGYSSLGYLKKAPFDKIKIDQSFVRGATMKGSRNGAIIASIVSLAESLGMETTAEGVETLDELELIRLLGCSHIQGYIYSKPLDPASASQRLLSGLQAIAQGPRSARVPRRTMLRKVRLEHGGESYYGTIRNVSREGAMIEGLWNVPTGTVFTVHIADGQSVRATARWSQDDRIGVEFEMALTMDADGGLSPAARQPMRMAGDPQARRQAG